MTRLRIIALTFALLSTPFAHALATGSEISPPGPRAALSEAVGAASRLGDPRMAGFADVAAALLELQTPDGAAETLEALSGVLASHAAAAHRLRTGSPLPGGPTPLASPDALALFNLVESTPTSLNPSEALALLRALPSAPDSSSLWEPLGTAARTAESLAAATGRDLSPLEATRLVRSTLRDLGAPGSFESAETTVARALLARDLSLSGRPVAEVLAAAIDLQPSPDPGRPLPPAREFSDLGEAVAALRESLGAPRAPSGAAELERLASLDPAQSRPLVRIVAAYLVYLEATRLAMAAEPADFGLLLAARRHVALEAAAAAQEAECIPGLSSPDTPRFSYDFSCTDTRYERDVALLIDLGGNDTYLNNAGGTGRSSAPEGPFDAALLVDVAGDDAYVGAALGGGGVNGGAIGGSGVLLDLGGNDRYETRASTGWGGGPVDAALNGGARPGFRSLDPIARQRGAPERLVPASALLVDAAGDDLYSATTTGFGMLNGAAGGAHRSSAGLLVDLGGSDRYVARLLSDPQTWAEGAANGGTRGFMNLDPPVDADAQKLAHGGLVDLGIGNDVYDARLEGVGGVNGAAVDGVAFLVDGGGDDVYEGRSRQYGAVNGAAFGYEAEAALIDLGLGRDAYHGSVDGPCCYITGAVNGAAFLYGRSLLLDGGGDDEYHGVIAAEPGSGTNAVGAVNGGALYNDAVSALIDLGGRDTYAGRVAAGLADRYELAFGALNGGAYLGHAMLLDAGLDDDVYDATLSSGTGDGAPMYALGGLNGGAFTGRAVLFDQGGADRYRAALLDGLPLTPERSAPYSFGGANGGGIDAGIGLLVDGGGDDTYDALLGGGGANGGGGASQSLTARDGAPDAPLYYRLNPGVGVLWDAAGDDSYSARLVSGGANGGGQSGAGLLMDAVGDDRYTGFATVAGAFHGGSSWQGVGILLDGAGNDRYDAGAFHAGGFNGGAAGYLSTGDPTTSAALLFDGHGNDEYVARIAAPRFDDGWGRDASGGANGGGSVGVALLIDAAGDDLYDGRIEGNGAVNGAGHGGAGALLDLGGNDEYRGTILGPLDLGESPYRGYGSGAVNGGTLVGAGVLFDARGDDRYLGRIAESNDPHGGFGAFGGVNGGALMGFAALLDGDGSNLFDGYLGGYGGSHGGAGGFPPDLPPGVRERLSSLPVDAPTGIAVILGGTGDDLYLSRGTTQGAANAYGVGILLDPGGDDRYVAGVESFAQGAAVSGGVGALIDAGGDARFELAEGSHGQGFASQGVGVLLTLDTTGDVELKAHATARISTATGAGIGLRITLGIGTDDAPAPSCSGSPELAAVADPAIPHEIRVCSPDEGTRVTIPHPVEKGQPLGDLPKPPVPCDSTPVPLLGATSCEEVVESKLGPLAADWLQRSTMSSSTSGGLAIQFFRPEPASAGVTRGLLVMPMADDGCWFACSILGVFE